MLFRIRFTKVVKNSNLKLLVWNLAYVTLTFGLIWPSPRAMHDARAISLLGQIIFGQVC